MQGMMLGSKTSFPRIDSATETSAIVQPKDSSFGHNLVSDFSKNLPATTIRDRTAMLGKASPQAAKYLRSKQEKEAKKTKPKRKLQTTPDSTEEVNLRISALNKEIEERRKATPIGELVNIDDLDINLTILKISKEFDPLHPVPGFQKETNIINGLDLSNCDLSGLNLNGKYFVNCNFSGSKFPSSTNLTLDGCNLDRADFSDTTQRKLTLGEDIQYYGREVSGVDTFLTSSGDPSEDTIDRRTYFQEAIKSSKPTIFTNVNLRNSTLIGCSDNVNTDHLGTDYSLVKVTPEPGTPTDIFQGKNFDGTAMLYRRFEDGPYSRFDSPTPSSEVEAEAGEFVAAMLRNNLIERPDKTKKTVIAIAPSGEIGSDGLDKCLKVFSSSEVNFDSTYEALSPDQLTGMVDLFNEKFGGRFNVKFVPESESAQSDYRLRICKNTKFESAGFSAFYGLQKGSDSYFEIGYGLADLGRGDTTKIHEALHAFGAQHPFETGIDPTKCTRYSSAICYNAGSRLMIPLTAQQERPAELLISFDASLSDPGPQDQILLEVLFGRNPDYVPRDISSNVSHEEISIIRGDEGHSNQAHFESSSLPENVKYKVFNASSAIGSCYQFPCDESDAAIGTEGKILVFYDDSNPEKPTILGNSVLYGGLDNDFFVDGTKIEISEIPISPTPSASPTPTPSSSGAPEKESTSNITRNILIGVAAGFTTLGLLTCAIIKKLRKRDRVRGDFDGPEAISDTTPEDAPEDAPKAAIASAIAPAPQIVTSV